MQPVFVKHPRRWFAVWAALLALGFVGVYGVDRAILAYSERVRASDYMTYVAEATHMAEVGQLEEAFIPLREALALAPYAPEPHLVHGHLHYRLQQWEDALLAYRRALQYGTPEIGARLNAMWASIQLGRYADAVALGEVSIKSGFTSPVMVRYIAEAYYRAGDYAEAIPYIEEALKGYPNDLYLWEHLMQAGRRTENEALEQRARNRIQSIQGQLDAVSGAGL